MMTNDQCTNILTELQKLGLVHIYRQNKEETFILTYFTIIHTKKTSLLVLSQS